MCYNEELLLPYTLKHYKERFPSAKFVLVDNYSTDNSHTIAKENDMEIRLFDTGNKTCEITGREVKNNIWKDVKEGWVIMCDMDEWLEMTEQELEEEEKKGTTIITTNGMNIIGDSKTIDLSDVNLFEFDKGIWDLNFCKRVLFKVPDVNINYWWGAHSCHPEGNIVYSAKKYILKHMSYLGEEYLVDKFKKRFDRAAEMRSMGMDLHYTDERQKVIDHFNKYYNQRVSMLIEPDDSQWIFITI